MKIRFIPILKKKKIHDLYDLSEEYPIQKFSNDVIIFAGGKGERLGKLTKKTPKPLIKIGKISILENLLKNFKQEGFYNFTIITNYLSDKIINKISDGKKMGVKINYIVEKKALGTLGGISLIKKPLSEDVIISNADIVGYINLNEILEFHKKKKNDITVGSSYYNYNIPYGVIKNNKNSLTKIEEKPSVNFNVNAGIYVFKKRILKKIKYNSYLSATDFINQNINLKIKIFTIFNSWIDVGNVEQLNRAKKKVE